MHSEQDIIAAIKRNEDSAIQSIYNKQYTSIKKMVYSFRNTRLDPEDIFQEGLTRAILNIRAGKFRGTSSLATYLNGICRNICLKQLSKPDPVMTKENLLTEEPENENYYELLGLINEVKGQMGDHCREIINLRFRQPEETGESTPGNNKLNSFDEIARKLGITVDNARQRFKRCLDQLRESIFAHPEYQTLFD